MNYEIHHGNSLEILPTIISKYPKAIVVTDPPFNVGYHYNEYDDNMPEDEYYEMLSLLFGFSPFVVIHYPENIYKIAFAVGQFPDKVVSWVYNSNTAKQHRDIAFFGVTPDFRKYGQPYKNPEDSRIAKRISEGKIARLYDWWEINQVKNVSKTDSSHPCHMPLEVMRRTIAILPDDAVIIDPFMGSGTTGIAAIEQNKQFIGIEMDSLYYQEAFKQLQAAQAQKPLFDIWKTR